MDVPTRYPGEVIRAHFSVQVRTLPGPTNPKRCVAVFAHEQDQTKKIELTGVTMTRVYDADPEVEVSAPVTPDNKPGLYRCESLELDYGRGHTVPFDQAPDVAFRIGVKEIRKDVPAPKMASDWRWSDPDTGDWIIP